MYNKLESKQEEEKQLLRYFASCYEAFPKGRIIKTESPDFIIQKSRHHRIGIELTKLYLFKAADQLHFVPSYNEEKMQLIEAVKQRLWNMHPFNLYCHFDFSLAIDSKMLKKESRVEEIVEILDKRLSYWTKDDSFYIKIKSKYLPDYLSSIILMHHPEDTISNWIPCMVNVPAENFLESIKQAISLKNEKLEIYRTDRLDEYWLLIEAECLNCASPFKLDDLIDRWEFESGFNKVFLFELFERKIHRLNV